MSELTKKQRICCGLVASIGFCGFVAAFVELAGSGRPSIVGFVVGFLIILSILVVVGILVGLVVSAVLGEKPW